MKNRSDVIREMTRIRVLGIKGTIRFVAIKKFNSNDSSRINQALILQTLLHKNFNPLATNIRSNYVIDAKFDNWNR
jgi:hypothetical protein